MKLPTEVFVMLKAYRVWQNAGRLKLGKCWEQSNRLFTTFNGGPMHPDTITYWFSKFVSKNSLPKVSIQSLRHTNITLLIMAGVPLQTVAKRAGHSCVVTTILIYSHAIQSVDEMASEVLGIC